MLNQSIFGTRKYLNTIKLLRSTASIVNSSYFNSKNQYRNIATTKCKKEKLASQQVDQKLDWNRAMSDAEKVVGHPTSFLSLRWLLSDEIANIGIHLRKLVGSKHPLMQTAKSLLYNGKETMQAWGLIVLLLSKAGGHSPNLKDLSEQEKRCGILQCQKTLAELTEMIKISQLIHQSLVNLQPHTDAAKDCQTFNETTFGNKITLLSGDYLMGHASAEMATIRNVHIFELISGAVRDFAESEFIGDRDEQNNALPSKPLLLKDNNNNLDIIEHDFKPDFCNDSNVWKPISVNNNIRTAEIEWEYRHLLSVSTLLSRSCKGTLLVAGLPEDVQNLGFLFGRHFALAWQASLDIEFFENGSIKPDVYFSLISAPVLFHLEYDPSIYEEIEKGKKLINNIDFIKIYNEILNGPAIQKTRDLKNKHTDAALKILNQFPDSDARVALENIILAMESL